MLFGAVLFILFTHLLYICVRLLERCYTLVIPWRITVYCWPVCASIDFWHIFAFTITVLSNRLSSLLLSAASLRTLLNALRCWDIHIVPNVLFYDCSLSFVISVSLLSPQAGRPLSWRCYAALPSMLFLDKWCHAVRWLRYICYFIVISGLEVWWYGTICHTDTCLAGLKPYCHFLKILYRWVTGPMWITCVWLSARSQAAWFSTQKALETVCWLRFTQTRWRSSQRSPDLDREGEMERKGRIWKGKEER